MKELWLQISWLRTAVVALLGLLAGGLLIIISLQLPDRWYGTLLNHLGTILIASIALVLIFDYWQKDALFRELFRHARSATELQAARIAGFSSSFQDQIPWEDLFGKSTHLDILFAYGATWRNTHSHRIDALLARDRARLGVVLPDPEDADTVRELSTRFRLSADDVRAKIEEAIMFFTAKRTKHPGKVRIYLLGRAPTHTIYRFNNEAVLALYTHRRERTGVPTFLVERGGDLYEFLRSEWYSLTEEGVRHGDVRELP